MSCNINTCNFDGIENGEGRLGSFKQVQLYNVYNFVPCLPVFKLLTMNRKSSGIDLYSKYEEAMGSNAFHLELYMYKPYQWRGGKWTHIAKQLLEDWRLRIKATRTMRTMYHFVLQHSHVFCT